MKRYTGILLFWVILSALDGNAQSNAPGYLGKKTLIGVSYQYAPDYGALFYQDDLENFTAWDVFLPSPRLALEIKRVIRTDKTLNIGLAWQSLKLADHYEDFSQATGSYYQRKELRSRVMTLNVSVSTHPYHVAPVGFYGYYGGGLAILNTDVPRNNSEVSSVQSVDLCLNYGFGTRRVVADKLALDLGIDMNLYFGGFFSLLGRSSYDISTRIKSQSMSVNFLNNIVSVRAGAYYLL